VPPPPVEKFFIKELITKDIRANTFIAPSKSLTLICTNTLLIFIKLCFFHFTGILVVFGGTRWFNSFDAMSTMEYLNETAWVTQPLKYPRAVHAMVVLSCP
jgi:hypothetical protein